jgi:predicted DNA-binding protein (MmcQ/YjbR family)
MSDSKYKNPEPPTALHAKHAASLHEYALAFPETVLEHPWEHDAYKVNKKIFLFLNCDGDGLRLTMKLPESNFEALLLPFTEATGYGLGKSGWVTARFEPGSKPPMVTILDWVLESYRAVAPKRALKVLDGEAPTATNKRTASKGTAKKKVASKKAAKRTTKKSTKKKTTK